MPRRAALRLNKIKSQRNIKDLVSFKLNKANKLALYFIRGGIHE
jgi:hypothetical protein